MYGLTISRWTRLLPILAGMLIAVQLFGQEDAETSTIPLELRIEGGQNTEITALLSPDTQPQLQHAQLLEALKPELSDAAYSRLAEVQQYRRGGTGYVALPRLRELGLKVNYSRADLRIRIAVPADMRPISMLPLQEHSAPSPDEISAAPFSFYLNYHSHIDLLYRDPGSATGSETDISAPLQLNVYPNLQLLRWVTEGGLAFRNDREPYTKLEYLRLIKDLPAAGLRIAVGTVDAAAEGAITGPPIDGITVGSTEELRHISSSYRSSSRELLLEEPAEVSIYLNGRLLKRSRLSAGRHSLLDIPYHSGLNELRITLRPEEGEERLIRTIVPFDARLLPGKELAYAASLGMPQHRFSDPFFSGYLRYGLSQKLTTGLALQSNSERHLASGRLLFATPLGNWGATAGVSSIPAEALGLSGSLQYRLSFPFSRQLPSLGLRFDYRSPAFRPSVTAAEAPSYTYQTTGSVGQVLPWESYLSFTGSYGYDAPAGEELLRSSLTFLKSIGDFGSLTLSMGIDRVRSPVWEPRGSIAFSITPRKAPHSAVYSQDLTSGEAQATYSYSEAESGSASYTASVRGFPPGGTEQSAVEGGATFTHSFARTTLNAQAERFTYDTSADAGSYRVGGGMSGALLIAEGHFAFTPPVHDSFLFIVPEPSLEGRLLSARTNRNTQSAKESTGAVIGFANLSSYTPTVLELSLPLSDPNTVLREDQLRIVPSYRSGIIVRAGVRTSVAAEGTLRSADGEPISLKAGTLTPLDTEKTEQQIVFTDETGSFQFHDLTAGRYRLTLRGAEEASVTFTIPEGAESPYRLGKLVLANPTETTQEEKDAQ